MKRYVAAALSMVIGIVAGAPATSAQFLAPIVVESIQKSPNSVSTLPVGTQCATFLQDMQKAPKSFKIASMHTSMSDTGVSVRITYTLDGPMDAGPPPATSQVIVTCVPDLPI